MGAVKDIWIEHESTGKGCVCGWVPFDNEPHAEHRQDMLELQEALREAPLRLVEECTPELYPAFAAFL